MPYAPVTSRLPLVVSAVIATLVAPGCQTTTSTTPSTTEPFRPGIANATALENLPQVRNFEQASGRQSVLVMIVGPGVGPVTGRITSGSGWEYGFEERLPEGVHHHIWRVTDTGAITVQVNVMLLPRGDGPNDIAPFFVIDSDQAAALAWQYGGQRYLARYPGAYFEMASRVTGGVGYWETKYWGAPLADRCVVPIVINAGTGELVSADTSCLDP